jgi:hypothetical protein
MGRALRLAAAARLVVGSLLRAPLRAAARRAQHRSARARCGMMHAMRGDDEPRARDATTPARGRRAAATAGVR